jgi:hypothetical protein
MSAFAPQPSSAHPVVPDRAIVRLRPLTSLRPPLSQAVLGHVKSALAHRGGTLVTQGDVGVVSPYHQQVKKIRRLLEKHGLEGVKARRILPDTGG